jgi:hypothetical protein
MGLNNVKDLVDAENEGRYRAFTWRKTPSQTVTAGLWYDLSSSPGNPAAKFWFTGAPLAAQSISQSDGGSVFHGANVAPSNKYLRKTICMASAVTPLPIPILFCDYLLFYPTIDDSTLEEQLMDNAVTLPRYADGEGVQVIAVSLAGRTGGQSFYFTYTNSQGISGRVSQVVFQNNAAAIGTLQCSGVNADIATYPFIGLQAGDTGVRQIDSVFMSSGTDTGLFSLILVKPLAQTQIREQTAAVERDYFLDANNLPIIKDDAFIGVLVNPRGAISATAIIGDFQVAWDRG